MGFIKSIIEFITSLFGSSSPEYAKKQELKKYEAQLKLVEPCIYKTGMLMPEMGGLFKILYDNTRYIYNILSKTICTKSDLHNKKYEAALLETGLSPNAQDLIEKFSYENRKNDVLTSDLVMKKVFEAQRKQFDQVVREASSADFKKVDETIAVLKQLFDLCCYDFEDILHKFNPEFSTINMSAEGTYRQLPLDAVGSLLQDYYYITASLKINTSAVRALSALDQINRGVEEDKEVKEKITNCLKKINSIQTKILTPENLKALIILWRKDVAYEINVQAYDSDASGNFLRSLQTRYDADENTIKMEIKDRNVAVEQKKLFQGRDLENVDGYNAQVNELLRKSTSYLFEYISPIQILKTFLKDFYNETIQALMEDIVIEGFFNNNTYKSDFSSRVYAAKEFSTQLQEFEKTFERNQENDVALIRSHIEDGHKNPEFIKKLGAMVEKINYQAHNLIQNQVNGFKSLYFAIKELLNDSKKSQSSIIVNIKVLFNSSRNKDAAQLLENNFGLWETFFEIMKNYAIIGDIEKK